MVQILDGSLGTRLALLSAPAGFGKTTAIIDWLRASGVRHAWLSLDETDNDPARFRRYLSAAIGEGTGEASEPASGPWESDPIDIVSSLASQLAERRDPSVLVLDDYHVITAPAVQRAVGQFLDRLPPQARFAPGLSAGRPTLRPSLPAAEVARPRALARGRRPRVLSARRRGKRRADASGLCRS